MKKLVYLLLALSFYSCSSSSYYQLYKANAEKGTVNSTEVVFENEHCKVTYNLWSKGGDSGFKMFNKTEGDIVVDLDKSFFVINDVSRQYYQDRTITEGSSTGTSYTYGGNYNRYYTTPRVTNSTGVSNSTAVTSRATVTIPPKAAVVISEFKISTERYVNCDLPKYPTGNEAKTLTFTADNSPIKFYNLLSYTAAGASQRFENKFYVSQVTNYTRAAMYTKLDKTPCGNKLDEPSEVFKYAGPDKFYFKYD